MAVSVTTISSKGQIVIPKELRKNLNKGDKLLIIRDDDRFMMKKLDGKFDDDLEFARRTEEAWMRIAKGEYKEKSERQFLRELHGW